MAQNGPHLDTLVPKLVDPMLDEFYGTMALRADVAAIANEIRRRYLAKLAPHNETGNLASTARVTTRRATDIPDRRWEAIFEVGGPRADYAQVIEEKYGLLGEVLRDMGFYAGDSVAGPTGAVPREVSTPALDRASNQE